MSKLYFVNFNLEENSIRSTASKMFYNLNDVKNFISNNVSSGYIIEIVYDNNIEKEKNLLGFYNGFEPSATECDIIYKIIKRKINAVDINTNFNPA